MRPIIQPIGMYIVSPVQLIKPRRVNHNNQIFLTMAIRKIKRKRYIKSPMRILTHIQKTFIHPLNGKTRRFNTQIKDLMKWTLISFVLRLHTGNMKPFFPLSPNSTNTKKKAALAHFSPCCLVPLFRSHSSQLSLQDP